MPRFTYRILRGDERLHNESAASLERALEMAATRNGLPVAELRAEQGAEKARSAAYQRREEPRIEPLPDGGWQAVQRSVDPTHTAARKRQKEV